MRVEKATQSDLENILGWLEREYNEDDGEGFWCNRNVISRALHYEELWVIREGGEAVAFQVGDYSADITCVRKDKQRQGFGTALFEASLVRAIRDDVNLLSGECHPRTSLPFWQKHGFQRYGNLEEWGKITVRKVLQRNLDAPANLPRTEVTISFYPEHATLGRDVAPVVIHQVAGGLREDGTVLLERRVIGLKEDVRMGVDLAVRIEVDGVERCFCKAKYDEAKGSGVQHDWKGGTFYVDAVQARDV